MEKLIVGFGLVLVFEGVPWFLSPGRMRRFVLQLSTLPEGSLRLTGFFSMMAGLLVVYLATRGWGG